MSKNTPQAVEVMPAAPAAENEESGHAVALPPLSGTPSIEALISQAISSGVSVDTMERLLAMRRELKAEKAKEDYDNAMAKFQQECPVIAKTKKVYTNSNQLAYSYAPLESIVSQVKKIIAKHGFSYATQTETLEGKDDTMVRATCIVKHKAGHSESSSMEVPLGNKTNIMSATQVVAAAITYAKRYAFCNAFGILTGDEDTDASPASMNAGQPAARTSAASRTPAANAPVIKGEWEAGQTKKGTMAIKSITPRESRDKKTKWAELETNLGTVKAWKNTMNGFEVGGKYTVTVEAKEYRGQLELIVTAVHPDEPPGSKPAAESEADENLTLEERAERDALALKF